MNRCLPSILKLRALNFVRLLFLFFFNCKHFIQVSVKEYLWKCMHAKIVPSNILAELRARGAP